MLIYYIIINLVALILMKVDKYKAIKHQYRISERTLMLVAVFGGSLGILLGMYKFRHKNKKIKFYLGVPIIIIMQCIIVYLLNCYLNI